jgi:hypothetical protein
MLKDLENKFRSMFGKKEAKDVTSDPAPSPDNKKKNSKTLQKVIIAGIVALAISEVLFPDKEESQDTNATTKTKKLAQENTAPKEEVTSPSLENTTSDEISTNVESDSSIQPEPQEAISNTNSDVTEEAPKVEQEEPSSEIQEIQAENNTETPKEISQTQEQAPAEINILPREETEVSAKDEVVPEIENIKPTEPQDSNLGSQIEQIIQKVEKDSLKKSEYAPPPDYSKIGRGLVYNCKEKHWACLDRDAYVQCMANREWTKNNNRSVECATKDVYQTDEDCQTVQVYNINMLVKPDVCSE